MAQRQVRMNQCRNTTVRFFLTGAKHPFSHLKKLRPDNVTFMPIELKIKLKTATTTYWAVYYIHFLVLTQLVQKDRMGCFRDENKIEKL